MIVNGYLILTIGRLLISTTREDRDLSKREQGIFILFLIGYIPLPIISLIDHEEAHSSKIIFAFLGAFAIMFLYNSFIYFSTWLKAYGYYLIGLFFVAFHTAGNAGYIFPLFGWIDSFPRWFFNFNLISSNLWGIVY